MMKLTQASQAMRGRLQGKEASLTGVSTDTRTIQAGELFFALRGDNFDGAAFVATAAAAGACAAVVNADSEAMLQQAGVSIPLIFVENTTWALGQLAAWWRKQLPLPLVAVTGSNGKTSVKEMLASILRAAAGSDEAVLATKGNLNNDIGMPLTLLRLRPFHRYAVIEMGMNHPGEIEYLTQIAEPDVALVNNASGAHLEGLGTVEAVAHAKGEIFSGLKDNGTAIINADDAYASLWQGLAGTHAIIEFALHNEADVAGQWQALAQGLRLTAQTPVGEMSVILQVPGQHNAYNALAATAAALALNVPLDSIVAGLEKFSGVSGRLQRKTGKRGALIIDDAYNANPASLNAAIHVLAEQVGKRVLVMGDMGELGDAAAELHAQVGKAAREAGINKLYALGELSQQAVLQFGANARHFDTIDSLQAELLQELDANTTVLVKGSRFMKMERVVQFCTEV